MATKQSKKAKPEPTGPRKPERLDDTATAPDDHVVPGQFVRVIAGPHEGRYGVFIENAGGEGIIIRTRDEHEERIVADYGDCRPAQAGGR